MKTEVNVADRDISVESLRMALAMAEVGASYEIADLIAQVNKELQNKGGAYSINDSVQIFFKWKKKWREHYEKQVEKKFSDDGK